MEEKPIARASANTYIEELGQSDELFRQLAENIRDVFFLLLPDQRRMAYINPAYEEVFGRSRQELYSHADAWIDFVHPEDRDLVRTVFAQSMQRVKTTMEYRIIPPDGSIRWIYARSFPVESSQGKSYRVVGIAEDIADRKAAAEAANRARSEFLANISYKIRPPMSGIIGMTELLLDTELTPEQAKYLHMIKTSADSLLTIINDVEIEAKRTQPG